MLEVQRSTLQAEHSVPTWHTVLRRGEFGTFLERRLWPVLVFRALIRNSWQYLQLHAAVPAVTRRAPWPASTNAGTATCGYRFWQVSFLTLPALHLRQLHAILASPTRNRDRIGTDRRCDSGSTSSPKNTAAFSSGRRLRRPRHWPSPGEVQVPLGANRTADAPRSCCSEWRIRSPLARLPSLPNRRIAAALSCPFVCHALDKTLLRSSLPSAADLGHASRDVERFHWVISTELGLLH
jgi:hypothetical protein